MKAKQAVEHIRESITKAGAHTVFTVEAIDGPKFGHDESPINIMITGTHEGESATAMILVHPNRPFDNDAKKWLNQTAIKAGFAIVVLLREKVIVKRQQQNHARNN